MTIELPYPISAKQKKSVYIRVLFFQNRTLHDLLQDNKRVLALFYGKGYR
jgi:hypothetical protein